MHSCERNSLVFNRENGTKKPLSDRERETLKLLRGALPECDIHANMRLADVIKAGWRQFNFIKSYHLDFVICDQDGHTVAAVELDDSTHDNRKARERDAKKDGWLRDAGIKIIRIRKPHEANKIRQLIEEYQPERIFQEPQNPPVFEPGRANSRIPPIPVPPIHPSKYTRPRIGRSRHITTQQIFTRMAVTVIGMFVVWMVFANFVSNQQKRMIEASQKAQQQMKQRAAEQQAEVQRRAQAAESLRRKQEAVSASQTEQLRKYEQALIYQHELKVAAQQPRYERVFVRAKSGEECRKGNVIDNEVVRCMADHYEIIETKNGTQ
ncbi:hypothetical protein MTYP_03203 [Methylophilaceae bacterium]|nr:hypothetical protein MTYP_03203 [Methylophilaceae bacterium]